MNMEFSLVTATSQGLAALSNYFFIAGAGLLVVMTLAYLWYTIGSARLANKIAVAQARTRSQAREASKAAPVAVASEGGVTTLVKDNIVMREQDDGEKPIALDHTIITVGRAATMLGWGTVLMLFVSLLIRAIIEQHAPWSNLYEFSLSFTTALLLCYLIFEARFHERVRAWGLYVCLLAVITLGIAIFLGVTYDLINGSAQLIPALQDKPILTIH